MSPAMALHNHGARIDGAKREFIPLHRGSIEADESCAPEGCFLPHPMDENQGDGPIKKAPRVPRKRQPTSWVGPLLGVLSLLAVAVGSYFAMVAK